MSLVGIGNRFGLIRLRVSIFLRSLFVAMSVANFICCVVLSGLGGFYELIGSIDLITKSWLTIVSTCTFSS